MYIIDFRSDRVLRKPAEGLGRRSVNCVSIRGCGGGWLPGGLFWKGEPRSCWGRAKNLVAEIICKLWKAVAAFFGVVPESIAKGSSGKSFEH